MTNIVLIASQAQWQADFAEIKHAVAATLGDLALQIDHIGSTSIPHLYAKDVIDVQVTVAALTPTLITRFTEAGYQHHPHLEDHVPLNADDDPKQWQKYVFTEPAGERRTNIHVRVAGRLNQQYALLFRDYLRATPTAVQLLDQFKRDIVKHHAPDVDAYYAFKDPYYDQIWLTAQRWDRLRKVG